MKNMGVAFLLLALPGCASHSRSHSGHQHTTYSTSGPRPWADEDTLQLAYRVEGNDAVMDSNRLTIIFPNLPSAARDSFSFQQGKVSIQIGGESTSSVTVECRRNNDLSSFQSQYANGANTVTFCGRQVRILDHGRSILTAKERFDSSAGKPSIRVAAHPSR